MSRVRVFVSFDLDHDNDLKSRLVDQATVDGSPFTVVDWSIREVAGDWAEKARKRMANVDLLLAICGEHTDTAAGVSTEIVLAREANRPYLLLDGRPGRSRRPPAAHVNDRVLNWNPGTWRAPVAKPKHGSTR